MRIVENLKNFINKIRNKNSNSIVLNLPNNDYDNLISSSKIDSIINNMPKGLSQIE